MNSVYFICIFGIALRVINSVSFVMTWDMAPALLIAPLLANAILIAAYLGLLRQNKASWWGVMIFSAVMIAGAFYDLAHSEISLGLIVVMLFGFYSLRELRRGEST